jgi:hypothetical protein
MVASMTGRADEAAKAFAIAMALGRTHGVPNLIGYVLTAQVYTRGEVGLETAREALDWWRDHRDVGNKSVVIEATGINLVDTGRVEDGGLLLGHIGSEVRRIASTAARRDEAIHTVTSTRRGRAAPWSQRSNAESRATSPPMRRSTEVAPSAGFEPATPGSGNQCSIP